MRTPPKILWFLMVLPSLFGFDFWTKDLARELPVGGRVEVYESALFDLAWLHAENPDIAFSLPVPMPVVLVFGFIALGVLAHTLWSMRPDARLQAVAVATLCAGALGNLVDRLVDGSVTDMIAVSTRHEVLAPWFVENFGTATWPIFNVADMAILMGVVLYAAAMWTEPEPDELEPSTA